jgi:hypothetical protein
MPADVAAAERFVLNAARLLDRHRLAALMHDASAAPVLDALRAYRNPDGGFGHALEPDVRTPHSEVAATLTALHILAEVGASGDSMVEDAAAWVGSVASPDGALPFVLPTAADYPHAPWMVSSGEGSHLTFAIAGALWEAGSTDPWLERATDWCWAKLERPDELSAYWVKFSLEFLDAVPDEARAVSAIESLRPRIGDDGSIPVPGGTENERLTPVTLSERPGSRSRALFEDEQIERDLDVLESGQQDDGGWTFEWLAWSPGQELEWRGALTVRALDVLARHGRLALS